MKLKKLTRAILITYYYKCKVRYRGTLGGVLWVLLHPLAVYFIPVLVFKGTLGDQNPLYTQQVLCKMMLWYFFSQTVEMTSGQIIVNSQLYKETTLSPFIAIGAIALDNFLIGLLAFFCSKLLLYFAFGASIKYLLGHFLTTYFIFGLFTFAVSSLISVLCVFFRDLKFITTLALQLLFFLTPIIYTKELAPVILHSFFKLNPLYYFTELASYQQDLYVVHSFGIMIICMVSLVLLWNKKSRDVYHAI